MASFSFNLFPPLIPPSSPRRGPSLICISPTRLSFRSKVVANGDESRTSGAPCLMLPPTFDGGNTVYNFYSLTKKKVVNYSHEAFSGDIEVVGSSHGFLALFDKKNHNLSLCNPVSGRLIHLPSIQTLSLGDIGLGALDICVNKVIISEDASRALMIFGPANRLAFCCPGSSRWTPLGDLFKEDKFRMYARVYSDIVYSKRDKVFICYTNHDIEEWDLRLPGKHLNYKFKKYLPAQWLYGIKDLIDNNGCHFRFKKYLSDLIEKHLPTWNGIKDLIDSSGCNKEAYVVFAEHSNQLYVVYRYIMERSAYMKNMNRCNFPVTNWDDSYPHKTIGFSVYKVTMGLFKTVLQLKYMEEGSLDNLVMFLGRNHSFALTAQNYPELKSNSIYFTDNPRHTPLDWQTYGAHDTAIYCFNNRTLHPLIDYTIVSSIKGIVPPPIWFTPSDIR